MPLADLAPPAAIAPQAATFLGVDRSLTGRRWTGPDPACDRLAEALAQATGEPRPLCSVLARFGVAADAAAAYLAPKLRDLLPDPLSLRDMDVAADRVLAAVSSGQRIAIFADYDVDGAASAALLLRWLRGVGIAATLYVPDRTLEGYGPNPEAIARLGRAHDLIVCVDCGTAGHEALAAAGTADVVVLDHHLGTETLPPAVAVVNPNRADADGSLSHLCAASVVFLLLVEMNRRLRGRGGSPPDLVALIDLVALATVADVAPLIGVNRALVRQGLAVMRGRGNPGLAALADAAALHAPPDAGHLGFVLGPRINAGGRIGRSDLGGRLLPTDSAEAAAGLAARLDALNRDRRQIEAQVRDAALDQAAGRGGTALSWAAGEGWHPGVVGIVAARLKEATDLPSVVIGLEDGIGKGSARSVSGIDIGAAVQRLAVEGLLIAGGGHRMAAGLTVARDRLDAAMARLEALLARQGAGRGGPAGLKLDGALMPQALTLDLVAALERAGPFGAGAPRPRFALPDLRLLDLRPAGERHLRLRLSGDDGGRIEAIAFGAAGGPLHDGLDARRGGRLHLAGTLDRSDWQGRPRVEFRVHDAALA